MEVQLEHHENEPQEELILAPGSFKHHCRVCKRGFGCGRALGGHMRAHGIVAGDQEVDVEAGEDVPGRRMYALRANPNRLKTCQACDNCGMQFSSWKAFLDHHGKCSPSGGYNGNDGDGDEDGDSVLSSPRCHDGETDQDGGRVGAGGWSKLGKRSSRSRSVPKPADSGSRSEEEVLANWLVMLSSSSSPTVADQRLKVEPVAEEDREEEAKDGDEKKTTASKAAFECKGCKKVFTSHQALGGHRASHKTVKGCFAARLDRDGGDGIPPSPRNEEEDDDDYNGDDSSSHKAKPSDTLPLPKRKHKMHECSICRRTFSSGQALGGHKRCHWITSAGTLDNTTSPTLSKNINSSYLQDPLLQLHSDSIPMVVKRSSVPLDLNLPATEDQSSSQIQYHNGIISCEDDDDGGQVELERRMKVAKLRDLRVAMENVGGDASPWLQMGIGSTATNVVVGADT